MRTALVVGGTGPTGVHIIEGLVQRGLKVTAFHRGIHEAELPGEVEHLHADPHFEETIQAALGGRSFDLVIATYGRTRFIAKTLADRCGQFIGVGGIPIYAGYLAPSTHSPSGVPVLIDEEGPLVDGEAMEKNPNPVIAGGARFALNLRRTEDAVFQLDAANKLRVTWFRYPMIYDARNTLPWDWPVVRRLLDGRRHLILPDGGLAIHTRCAPRNAAHSVLLAVDQPEAARGKVFNCGDDDQFSLKQWVEMIVRHLGRPAEIVSMPLEAAGPAYSMLPNRETTSPHALVSTARIRADLGYRDVVAAPDALAAYVDELVARGRSAADSPTLRDPFDYALEDRLIEAYRRSVIELRQIAAPLLDLPPIHGYAHPRTAAQTADHRGR